MTLNDLIKQLGPSIGKAGIDALTDVFKDLSANQNAAWKKAALALVADAVEKNGPGGLVLALTALENMVSNKVPDINWADLRVASDALAQLQNAEADRQSEIQDYIAKISKTLGFVLSGVIKGLLAG